MANILKEHGVEPATELGRRTPWSTFPKAYRESIAAADFFIVEVWTVRGLIRYSVFFVFDISSRRVEVVRMSRAPNGQWNEQIARSLTDPFDGLLWVHGYFIHDRDPLFAASFDAILRSAGVDPIKPPSRSPNLNAYAERFVRSMKSECLDRMIFLGKQHLRHAIDEYMAHYHEERSHQGLGDERPVRSSSLVRAKASVQRSTRLGGMLNHYHRTVA